MTQAVESGSEILIWKQSLPYMCKLRHYSLILHSISLRVDRLTHQLLGEGRHIQWSVLELCRDDGWRGTRLHYHQVMGSMVRAKVLHVYVCGGGVGSR
jgi:putative component of toxin-antitoxin plasmid stabilization module